MSDFIASQDPHNDQCGSRDEADAPATAALAITEDVSKAVAPDLAGIVKVAVRLAISDGEYIGRWSLRGMNPTEVIDVRERAEKARIDLILHHPSARFRERRNALSSGWLPIETAPRDGRPILVGHASSVFDAYWDKSEGSDGQGAWVDGTTDRYEDLVSFEPTHWMALPSCPGATASTTPAGGNEEVAAPVVQQPREDQKTASPLDRIDVEGLKAAAEKATPGEWKVGRHFLAGNISIESVTDRGWIAQPLGGRGDKQQALDFAFIAAANPATILALLAERAELIAQRAALVEALTLLKDRASTFSISGVYFDEPSFDDNVAALKLADAALSKALGQDGGAS